MASSIMHLAVINELTKKFTFKDESRLKFGAVLPDAGAKQAGAQDKKPGAKTGGGRTAIRAETAEEKGKA